MIVAAGLYHVRSFLGEGQAGEVSNFRIDVTLPTIVSSVGFIPMSNDEGSWIARTSSCCKVTSSWSSEVFSRLSPIDSDLSACANTGCHYSKPSGNGKHGVDFCTILVCIHSPSCPAKQQI